MIDPKKHPVGWSFLMDELQDAQEHLSNLIEEASKTPDYSEEELRIDLGHVYAHLNRAWFRRNVPEDFQDSERITASKFPDDLEPVG